MPNPTIPDELICRLRHAERVAVLTGAGISAESGVPTFRDAVTGLWAHYRPEDLATPEAYARDPQLVWNWYQWRRGLVAQAQPNAGHMALAQLEARFPAWTLITQNVDNLHRRAGSRHAVALHGDIARTLCSVEGIEVADWPADGPVPPRCPHCGAGLRPGVVWFGEDLPHAAIDTAFRAAETCDVFLCVGTSTLVYPAAELPFVAHRHRACVVEINPDETPLSPVADYRLAGPAGVVLPALVEALATADAVAGQA